MTFSRSLMPQIKDEKSFLANLSKHNVKYAKKTIDPNTLKSTQSEFDKDKIICMMAQPYKNDGVIVSNDGYVLDGHHRWIVAHNMNKKLQCIVVDLPILDLVHLAKSFDDTTYRSVTECVKNVMKEALENRIYK